MIRDEKTGRIDGVRYDELAPMFLNEVQQQRAQLQQQGRQLQDLQQLKTQFLELQQQNQMMQAAMSKTQTRNEELALR